MKLVISALVMLGLLTAVQVPADEKLSPEEMKLALNNYVVPTPDEIFTALESVHNQKWSRYVKINSKTSYKEVHKQCLNLGITVADMTLAIKSEDAKLTGQASEQILAFASYLGISNDIKPHIEKIKSLANNEEWSELLDRINFLQTQVSEILVELDSRDQVVLISIGGWIEGLNVVTKSLRKDYSEEATAILRITAQIDYFKMELEKLDPSYTNNPEIKLLMEKLPEIRSLCAIEKDQFVGKSNIKSINKITGELVKQFQK